MKKKLLMNTALLTGTTLLMRFIGMAFQVWLAGRIGAAGIGLYQLVMSVELLCVTLAVSGIRFAVTRLVSEELSCGRPEGATAAMTRCVLYSLFFGTAAAVLLRSFAEPVGFLWIGDARTVRSLRVLAVGLPFLSLSSVFSGYFTACGRVWKPALVHLLEQLCSIGLVTLLLLRTPADDIEKSCAAVVTGVTAADVLSFGMMLLAYAADLRAYGRPGGRGQGLTARMLGVALPLAASAYARSALSTLEHLLVPRGLRRAGYSADSALSGYGVIQGMVWPVLGFPASLLMALSELIIPVLTERQMQRDEAGIRRAVAALLTGSFIFSCAVAALLVVLSEGIGGVIYHSSEAGRYIRLLAPLVPVMYTDMVVDGCLKGLGQHLWSMGINILDAAIGVVLVYSLLPRGALTAYVGILYFNECLNFALSLWRLSRISELRGQRRPAASPSV